MAKKDALFGKKLVDAHSLAASFDSDPFRIKFLDNIGINISTASVTDNTGYFTVEHRIVKDDNSRAYSAWCPLAFGEGNPTLANANNTFLLNINQIPPGEIRVRFTADGSTPDGTVDVWVSATSLGG